MRQVVAVAALTAPISLGLTQEGWATEGGLTEYPIGADSYGVALRPPPGNAALLSYETFQTAKIVAGTQTLAGSRVNVFVSALRGVYTLPVSFDDGKVTIVSDLVVGAGNVFARVPTPGGPISGNSTGFIDVNPWIEAAYHDGPLFATAGLAVWLPWGTYNKNDTPVKGSGQNHYTFAPLLYLTYLATPKVQLDFASVTEINTVNPHTQYTSGSDETITVSASYLVAPHLQIGPTAYFYGQFSDDSQNGAVIPKGNRSQALGVGLQGAYSIGHGGIILKYYHQTLVQNRASGEAFWFQFAIPFSL